MERMVIAVWSPLLSPLAAVAAGKKEEDFWRSMVADEALKERCVEYQSPRRSSY